MTRPSRIQPVETQKELYPAEMYSSQSVPAPLDDTQPRHVPPVDTAAVQNTALASPAPLDDTQPRHLPSPVSPPASNIATYQPARWAKWQITACLVCAALSIALPAIAGLYQLYDGLSNHGYLAAQTWSLPWLALAFLAALAWLAVLVVYRLVKYRSLSLHRSGITLRLPLRPARTYTWESLDSILLAQYSDLWAPRRIQTRAHLRLQTGQVISLNRYSPPGDLVELVTRLKAGFYPRRETALQQELLSSKTLAFGPLSISLSALEYRRLFLAPVIVPWPHANRLSVQNGLLTITIRQDTAQGASSGQIYRTIPLGKIPNFEIFLKLCELAANEGQPPAS